MRNIAFVLIAAVTVVANSFAASSVEKPAVLLLPPEVSIHRSPKLTVSFRWDEDGPVVVETFSRGDRMSMSGDIQVFEESGKEVPMSFPMSLPPMPTDRKEVKKGEILQIDLHCMGHAEFPHPGRYYAIALFSGFRSDNTEVRFVTTKRWFDVVDEAPSKT